jgi:general secretion pathway protein E
VREFIGARSDSQRIAARAAAVGMTTMFDDGIDKCRAGTTSAAEVLRVTTAR